MRPSCHLLLVWRTSSLEPLGSWCPCPHLRLAVRQARFEHFQTFQTSSNAPLSPAPFCYMSSLGADGVMVPLVNTLEEAKAAVSYCLFAPQGIRSAVYPSRWVARPPLPESTTRDWYLISCIFPSRVSPLGDCAAACSCLSVHVCEHNMNCGNQCAVATHCWDERLCGAPLQMVRRGLNNM